MGTRHKERIDENYWGKNVFDGSLGTKAEAPKKEKICSREKVSITVTDDMD